MGERKQGLWRKEVPNWVIIIALAFLIMVFAVLWSSLSVYRVKLDSCLGANSILVENTTFAYPQPASAEEEMEKLFYREAYLSDACLRYCPCLNPPKYCKVCEEIGCKVEEPLKRECVEWIEVCGIPECRDYGLVFIPSDCNAQNVVKDKQCTCWSNEECAEKFVKEQACAKEKEEEYTIDNYWGSVIQEIHKSESKLCQEVCVWKFDLNGDVTGGKNFGQEVDCICSDNSSENWVYDGSTDSFEPRFNWENYKYYCKWNDSMVSYDEVNCKTKDGKLVE